MSLSKFIVYSLDMVTRITEKIVCMLSTFVVSLSSKFYVLQTYNDII